MFEPPRCANYGCENRIPRDRWLWVPGAVATCSTECAHAVGEESRVRAVGQVRRCARQGCANAVTESRGRCCSRSCAARIRVGERLGPNLYIPPAPQDDEVLVPGQCARPGCDRPVTRGKNRYCSHACAGVQTGGDRWEKVAPKMEYTPAIRDQMIRSLYRDETHRSLIRRGLR